MLVLSRQHNEALVLGDDLLLTVERIRDRAAEFCLVRGPIYGAGKHKLEEFHLDQGESFQIAPEVSCQLVEVRDDQIRIGFTMPKTLSLHRKEVYDAIRKKNRGEDTDGGLAGAPIPRNPKPGAGSASAKKHPPLDADD